ncbi:MAG: formyltransferase family protein [Patescibacteria group bacterium]|nr:MAG: formyltransferase family protein [Patescibacteria group bacterium]
MNAKIAIFGCKQTTRFMLEALLAQRGVQQLITISPELAAKNDVADYEDLRAFAEAHGIPCYVARSYALKEPEDVEAIRSMQLDLAFVIGWQRLIPANVLDLIRIGAFGMHGSAENLPKGRGRSPMNWSILEGRTEFYTNLFRYDPGVDSGAVLDTFRFTIRPEDTAETMHFKNALAMKRLIIKNLPALLERQFRLAPQSDETPTFYPKRNPEDSLIDWRADLEDIERFIRAVAPPFNGAFTYVRGEKITIHRASIFETDAIAYGQSGRAPGTVLETFPNGKWLVCCRGGILLVHAHEAPFPLKPGDLCVSPPEQIRAFPRNAKGFYDVEA